MKIEKEDVIIEISKIKAFILTLISFGFFSVLIWAFFKVEILPSGVNKTFLMIGTTFLIITSGLACLSGLAKLIDNKPGLLINNNGIQINIGPNRGHFIKWNEITRLKIHSQIRGPKFLLIFIENPIDFMTKSSGLKKFLLKMNNVSHKTPVSLTSNWLDCSFENLVAMIEDKYKKNGTTHRV
jgi:hypothetical protein